MLQHGLHQDAVEGGQHIDIDVIIADDLAVLAGGVELHVLFHRAGGGLYIDVAEGDLNPFFLQQLLSELDDLAHLQMNLARTLGILMLAEGHALGDHLAHPLQGDDLADCSALVVDVCHCHSSILAFGILSIK